MSEPQLTVGHIGSAPLSATDDGDGGSLRESGEDTSTQRRRLAVVWLSACSAHAAMVGTSWYWVLRNDAAPGGDMVGHAAAARWLRTLPWWDWRGWSDWFYGGQAIGVNYPPLSLAWMRFLHPYHAQMGAVALGLLVLLPWGTLCLARAMGYPPRAQRSAVAATAVLTAASANMHWMLPGFNMHRTFFGSWPAMLATVAGLFCAAWAARCCRPLACGATAGAAVLCNATVVPGIAVVCAVLLTSSGASLRQGIRWAATVATTTVAVTAWWLIPFLAGSQRLVSWKVPLSTAWSNVHMWGVILLALLAVATAWAARVGPNSARRLAAAAAFGLLATLIADLFGYLRSERWLVLPILVAAVAAAWLLAKPLEVANPGDPVDDDSPEGMHRIRPTWRLITAACLTVFVAVTLRTEVVPLAIWMLGRPQRTYAWSGALAWTAVLLWVPILSHIRNATPPDPPSITPLEAVAEESPSEAEGLVYLDGYQNNPQEDESLTCTWNYPWSTTADVGGRIRPLTGLYEDTSASAEFIDAAITKPSRGLHPPPAGSRSSGRPHWFEAWHEAGRPDLSMQRFAEALGARWYVACDGNGVPQVSKLSGVMAVGTAVVVHTDEESWHRSAVRWWIDISRGAESERSPIPVLLESVDDTEAYAVHQAASEVSMNTDGDTLTVIAAQPGWAWLRVPWDPHWRSDDNSPVLKGGPGHLITWVEAGTTILRWSVPRSVDMTAAGVTTVALLAAFALTVLNRRMGFTPDPDRRHPAALAVDTFADILDSWVNDAARQSRHVGTSLLHRVRLHRVRHKKAGIPEVRIIDGSRDRIESCRVTDTYKKVG